MDVLLVILSLLSGGDHPPQEEWGQVIVAQADRASKSYVLYDQICHSPEALETTAMLLRVPGCKEAKAEYMMQMKMLEGILHGN